MSKLSFITDERLEEVLEEFIDFMRYFKYEEKSLHSIFYKIENDKLYFLVVPDNTDNYENTIFESNGLLDSTDVFTCVVRDIFNIIEHVGLDNVIFDGEDVYKYVDPDVNFKELML